MPCNQNSRRRGSVCAWFRLNFCPGCYLQCLENYRVSSLKVVFFWNFLMIRYFCHASSFATSYLWFHKLTSENVRRILITPKTKFTCSSRWSNYGPAFVLRFVCFDWKANELRFRAKTAISEKGLYKIQTRLIKPGIETIARACLDLPQVDRNKSHLTWASAAGETLLYLHPSPRQVRLQNLKNNTMVLKYLLSKNKAVHLYYNLKRKRKKRASTNVLYSRLVSIDGSPFELLQKSHQW